MHGARMFLQCFPVSHTGNIVSSVSFQDANYAYATRQGILTKIRACEHLQTFCEHDQANTHLIFASNLSKGQILRALSNWMGPFYTPNQSINPSIKFTFPFQSINMNAWGRTKNPDMLLQISRHLSLKDL